MKAQTALVIRNPTAGRSRSRERHFNQAMKVITEHGWTIEIVNTEYEGHASLLAAAAVESGKNVVIAAGGDGTVNEVIQEIAHTKTALGVLPLGTVNVWSREAGYKKDPAAAAEQLVAGHRVTLDLGRVGSRLFLLMAGVGLDAEITAAIGTANARKQKLGVLPYILRAVAVVPRYRGASMEIEMDGRTDTHDALMVLVSNTRLYGGVSRPTPNAIANDGMLDVRVFRGNTPTHSVRHIARFLLERRGPTDTGEIVRVRKIIVNATPPLAVQVDGDPVGTTPVEIVVDRHALHAIVPTNYDTSLISPHHE